jgi:hypothetical protein
VAVIVGVGVGVGNPVGSTFTWPTMLGCASHTNTNVPAWSNRQTPAQPGGDGNAGSGGTSPKTGPAVCVQVVGSCVRKLTLWKLVPCG